MNPVLDFSSSTNMMFTILTLKTEQFWQIPGKTCVGTISRLLKLLCQPLQNRTVQDPDIELVTDVVNMLTLSKQFKCPECKAVFKIEGKLKQHTRTVHNQSKSTGNACEHCESLLSSAQALKRHIKTHLKCKVCKKEFDSIAETNSHMKSHTTCNICNYDFKTNFKRHMKDIHGETCGDKSARSKLAEVN